MIVRWENIVIKHVIILGQREFADIDIEENFGLYRFARRELLKKIRYRFKKCLLSGM